jgi:hypothetical protein
VNRRASQNIVEAELGPPTQKRKRRECADEWIYRIVPSDEFARIVGSDEFAAVCFDEKQQAVILRFGGTFERQYY